MSFSVRLAVLAVSFVLGAKGAFASAQVVQPETITVGVVDSLFELESFPAVREGLQAAMDPARWNVRVVSVLSADEVAGIDRMRPDFVLAPADLDLQFRTAGVASPFRIATRKTHLAADAARSSGALLVVRADRRDLRSISDLKGKIVAAGLPTALTGWLAVQNELLALGEKPDDFWKKAYFLSSPFPDVLSALFSGNADAAVLPACLFEQLASANAADISNLRVVNEKTDETLRCRRSTDLYPDISLWGFDWTNEERVRAFTVGLLTEKGETGFEWLSFVSHSAVDSLYRALEIGPYAYLHDRSIAGLYQRYSGYVHVAALFLLLLIGYEVRLQRLVARRTGELKAALSEQQRLEADARRDRDRLGSLEKRNIVSQMSAMIAHEVKSPVAAIGNFKAILDFVLPDGVKADRRVTTALSGIETEAERIAGIVNRVRNYAKSRQTAHKACDLAGAVRRALKSFRSSSTGSVPVDCELPASALVTGDALELELLVFNLIKNASEALTTVGTKKPRISVRITKVKKGDTPCWQMQVQDNGPRMTDEAYAHLESLMSSIKPEGLGLGLSIVRGIADSHGAGLFFERYPAGGLVVRFLIDALDETSGKEST